MHRLQSHRTRVQSHFIPSSFTLLGIKVVGKKDAGLKNVGGSAVRIIKYALAVMPEAVSG